jgi:hypothetical protein
MKGARLPGEGGRRALNQTPVERPRSPLPPVYSAARQITFDSFIATPMLPAILSLPNM